MSARSSRLLHKGVQWKLGIWGKDTKTGDSSAVKHTYCTEYSQRKPSMYTTQSSEYAKRDSLKQRFLRQG